MNDTRDEGSEVLLAVYEVRFVEGDDCVFEDVVAEVVADGGGGFEAGEEHAQDADGGVDGAGVADADAGCAEEEDGLEDRGRGEDEVADRGAFFARVFVEAGEFWRGGVSKWSPGMFLGTMSRLDHGA